MRKYTISALRADLYRLVDRVLETGVPVDVERNGKTVRIVPATPAGRLKRLKPHPSYLPGDPEDIVHMDWSGEWRP